MRFLKVEVCGVRGWEIFEKLEPSDFFSYPLLNRAEYFGSNSNYDHEPEVILGNGATNCFLFDYKDSYPSL